MNQLWQDMRYGARMLIKQPGFTLIAALTLALGIGANTAIFSIINALILNPPRIAEAERVAAIWRTEKDKRSEGYVSYLDLQDWRAQSRSFEAVAGYKTSGFILLNDEQAERLQGMRVTANFLSLQNDGDPERWEIVGVVGDAHHRSLTRPAAPELYLPYQQNSWSWGNFFVRTKNDPVALTRSFTEAVRSGDKTVPVINVRPLTQAISDTVAQPRFYTLLFALFGATGLLLTLTGVYSVISYTVSQQTQEIGVRMALGAQARDVLKLVIGQGMVLTMIGVGIGLLGALGLTRLMQTLLYSVSATDLLVFAGVAPPLIAVAMVACYVPARRATKVDPLVALRCE